MASKLKAIVSINPNAEVTITDNVIEWLNGTPEISETDIQAKIVELEGIPGTTAARDRGKGFNNVANENLEVVARQAADFDRTKGLTVMENILQAESEIDAVFAHNDEMALGALKAIEGSGKDILVVGFDATDDAVASVKDGKLGATVAQQPSMIGASGVEAALKIMNGEETEEFIPVNLELVK